MHATDIAGYTYNTEVFCPDCIVDVLTASPDYDGWALAPGVRMSTEANLREIAAHFGIDRGNEESFDSQEFPKVVFASQVHDCCEDVCTDVCASCGEAIGHECGGAW